jgi:alpha-amylase
VADNLQPVAPISVPYPISWADEERDLTAWLGNELQKEAFEKLYETYEKIERCEDKKLQTDWKYLQASDHFYYMCTKFFSDGEVHSYFNPFESPYDAFINFMNVLSDFKIRLNACVPDTDKDKEIANLVNLLVEKEQLLEKYEKQLQDTDVVKKTAKKAKKTPEVKKEKQEEPLTAKGPVKKEIVKRESAIKETVKKVAPKKKENKKTVTKKPDEKKATIKKLVTFGKTKTAKTSAKRKVKVKK